MLRSLPRGGVSKAVALAAERGYGSDGKHDWANLGRGSPETGELPGQPSRSFLEPLLTGSYQAATAYPDAGGAPALREAVATYYNSLYREGRTSRYTASNVLVCAGGRNALARVVASLNRGVITGVPRVDYPAYSELLGAFGLAPPSVVNAAAWAEEGASGGVSHGAPRALFLSNPTNPTGEVLHGEQLRSLLDAARAKGTTLVLDEFYRQARQLLPMLRGELRSCAKHLLRGQTAAP